MLVTRYLHFNGMQDGDQAFETMDIEYDITNFLRVYTILMMWFATAVEKDQ